MPHVHPAPGVSVRRHAEPSADAAPHVLLAEDDDEMRAIVASALRKEGCGVTDVPDGGRLLVHIATAYATGCPYTAYDVVISDVRMPVCSGLQMLEGLRRAHWSTPVILMTAFGDRATRARAESLGACLFDKPFDVDDLRAAVFDLFARRASARDPEPRSLTLLATFATACDALIVKRHLRAAGIVAYGVSDMAGLTGDCATLYVLDSDAESARHLIGRLDVHAN